MFVTFEGIDGSGKTSQMNILYDVLSDMGREVVKTSMTSGTAFSKEVMGIINGRKSLNHATELMLFCSMIGYNVANVVIPSLSAGKIVLCDRFVDSTIAYQHYGNGLPIQSVISAIESVIGGLKPDLTVYFNLPSEVAIKRLMARESKPEKYDKMDSDFYDRVNRGYFEMASSRQYVTIDATLPLPTVARLVRESVLSVIEVL